MCSYVNHMRLYSRKLPTVPIFSHFLLYIYVVHTCVLVVHIYNTIYIVYMLKKQNTDNF